MPRAFENASFAANLFAKQVEGFLILLHFKISSTLNNLEIKDLFLIIFFNLETFTMSVPIPYLFIIL